MKVKEMIELLQKEDQEREVIMSKDGEGNSFSPFSDADRTYYKAHNAWSGETGLEELTPELRRRGCTEEDVMKGGVPALVLWPTN